MPRKYDTLQAFEIFPELTPQQARRIHTCKNCGHQKFRYRKVQPKDLYHQRAMQKYAWSLSCDACGDCHGRVIKYVKHTQRVQAETRLHIIK